MNDTSKEITTIAPRQMVLLPASAMEMMELCKQLAGARLVPSAFQRSPADIFLAMSTCKNLGLDFFLTLPEISVIKGKLFFSGKLTAAILNSSGALAEHLSYEFTGEGPKRTVTVKARKTNEAEARTITLTWEEAHTENENWRFQPDQQLTYAGARVWGRRHAPEVLLGMAFEGEPIDVTPTRVHDGTVAMRITEQPQEEVSDSPLKDAVEARKIAEPTPPVEGVQPHTVQREPGEDWRMWGNRLIAYVRGAKSSDEILSWIDVNTSPLEAMQEEAPKTYALLKRATDQHGADLAKKLARQSGAAAE